MSSRKRVVLIGCGGRANAYLMYGAARRYDLVAIADPSPQNRQTFLGLNDLVGKMREFDDWRTMLEAVPNVDGVIITTPNHQHLAPAMAAMDRGHVVALEKPIAESPDSCRRLLAARRQHDARLLVGFVMRSTPFYQQAAAWIAAGRIGDVISIQADELPPPLTTSAMFRSDWRRYQSSSGGALLEKCCHDIDMLTWLAGGRPQYVSSFAGTQALGPRPEFPRHCEDCHITAQCPYFLPPSTYEHPDMVKTGNDGQVYKFIRDNSACIYNNGHDIYDHQQVLIAYDNGVTASLTLDFSGSGSACGRTLKVMGTEGVIDGRLEDNRISCHTRRHDVVETVELADDGSGHGGSNRLHADVFGNMLDDGKVAPAASLEAGYLSAMLCFAADQAAADNRVVDVRHLMAEAGLEPGGEEGPILA